jgi:hypothetical protein
MPQMSQGDSSQQPPLETIEDTAKPQSEKIIFVADADSKSWDVMNPESLTAHEGRHVELSAHVYVDKCQLHAMKVRVLKVDAKSCQARVHARERPNCPLSIGGISQNRSPAVARSGCVLRGSGSIPTDAIGRHDSRVTFRFQSVADDYSHGKIGRPR